MPSIYRLLVTNLSKLGFSLVVSMGIGVILKAYMPRVLGVESIGVFYYADSLSYIFFTFLPLGIHTYINRVIPPNPEKPKEIFRSIFSFMIVYGCFLWLMLWCYSYILGFVGQRLWVILLVGGFQFFNFLITDIFKPTFIAAEEINFVSRMDIIHKILQVFAVCIGLFIWPELLVAAIFFLVTQLVTLLAYIIKSIALGWFEGVFSFQHCREFLTIGLPFFINSALLSFYGNIDVAMLERLANLKEVGWYGASQQLKGIFMMVVPLLQSVIMPLLSKVYAGERSQFFSFSANIYSVLIFASWLLALIMCSFANEFVLLLFGKDFLPASRAVMLLAPVLLFTYMNVFLSILLNLISSGKALVLTTMASLLLNTVMNFFMIPWGVDYWHAGGGGVGASITTIFAEMMVFVVLLKLTPVPLMNSMNQLSSFLSFIVVGALIFLLMNNNWNITERIILFIIFTAVSGACGWLVLRKAIHGLFKEKIMESPPTKNS